MEIRIPDIGDFSDVPVIEVHVAPGDTVAVDDPLVTLESDKATMDIPAEAGASISARIVYDGPVLAPVEEGTRVGKLEVRVAGTISRETPLYAAESVPLGAIHQRALDAVKELLTGWLRKAPSS